MHPTQPADRTAQRRKLLKGALGASTVATLGYSRTVAAASVTACIANFPDLTLPAERFVNNGESSPPAGNGLAWKGVSVQLYSKNSNGNSNGNSNNQSQFYAVQIGDQLYPVADGLAGPGTGGLASLVPVTGFPSDQPSGFPRQAWTLVYFSDATRDEIGLYPNVTAPGDGVAPASLACLSSLNADLSGDYTFGG